MHNPESVLKNETSNILWDTIGSPLLGQSVQLRYCQKKRENQTNS